MKGALCLFILAWPAVAQTVTATFNVRVDGQVERVRKINGRWWSNDNRQMFPPKGTLSSMWIIQKKVEGVIFTHHRPFELARAESLHLFMTPETVQQTTGEPNEIFMESHEGRPIFYRYYGADGTCMSVRFMQNGLLGEAKYERLDGPLGGISVASVERDLGGRSIYKILADQASARVAQHDSERMRSHGRPSVAPVALLAPIEAPKPAARLVTAEEWKKLAEGMTREEVIAKIGEPLSTMKVAGSDPVVETLQYAFESEGDAKVRMEDGKVVKITPLP